MKTSRLLIFSEEGLSRPPTVPPLGPAGSSEPIASRMARRLFPAVAAWMGLLPSGYKQPLYCTTEHKHLTQTDIYGVQQLLCFDFNNKSCYVDLGKK